MNERFSNVSFAGFERMSADTRRAEIAQIVRDNHDLSECRGSLRHLACNGLTIRSADVRPDSLDITNRSVDAVIATENRTEVYDRANYQVIEEVLLMSGAGWYGNQVVLLECHNRATLDTIIGSVRSIRVEGSNLIGCLVFAGGSQRAEYAWRIVSEGHLTDVSIGYRVNDYVDMPPRHVVTIQGTEHRSGARPMRIVKHWTIRESSIVPIGADPDAKVRG